MANKKSEKKVKKNNLALHLIYAAVIIIAVFLIFILYAKLQQYKILQNDITGKKYILQQSTITDTSKVDYQSLIREKNELIPLVELLNKNSAEFNNKNTSDIITILGIFMTLIIISLTITLPLISNKQHEQYKKMLDTYINGTKENIEIKLKQFDIEKRVKDEVSRNFRLDLDIISRDIKLNFIEEMRNYKDILNIKTEEILGVSPKVRKLLFSVFGKLRRDIYNALKNQEHNPEIISKSLEEAIQKWFIIGQLFSTDEKQIFEALANLKITPFPEIKRNLKELKIRYQDDNDRIATKIIETIRFIEEQMVDSES